MESLIKRQACNYWRPRLLLQDLGLRREVRFLNRRRVLLHNAGAGIEDEGRRQTYLSETGFRRMRGALASLAFALKAEGTQTLHIAATDEIVVLCVEGRRIISKPCERLLSDRGVDFAKTQVIQWRTVDWENDPWRGSGRCTST